MNGHFAGYASLFGMPDLGRDTVMPGAFARRGAAGVRMLWQHDPAEGGLPEIMRGVSLG